MNVGAIRPDQQKVVMSSHELYAVEQANRWQEAHKLASSYMSEGEVRILYMEQAHKMEAADSLLDAEKLYLQVGEARV